MNPRVIQAKGNFDRIMFATVTGVNEKSGTVSLFFNDQFAVRDDVQIPVIAMSRNAWIRFIPQVNDVVHVGIRADDSAVILGWHPWAYQARVDGFEADNINQAGGSGAEMMQSLKPGEIDIRSAGGGYLRFNSIGDVLLMGLSGRIHFFGIENLTEHTQTAFKATDGLSWLRLGHVYRLFTGVSARELPTTGSGQPNSGPTPLRELDVRLFDDAGSPFVQESLGNVIDTNGVTEVSGTTGNGTTTKVQIANSGDAATTFFKGDTSSLTSQFIQSLGKIPDQVVASASDKIISLAASLATVIHGIGASDSISTTDTDLNGIITGTGPIGGDAGKLSGIGPIGKSLRRRSIINKSGNQVNAKDIDEDGGETWSSQSVDGVRINANGGGITFFAKKAIESIAKGIIDVAENITSSASSNIKLIAGNTIRRIAGGSIKDNANIITRTAQTTLTDKAGVTITHQSNGAIIVSAGTTISISATGVVTITGSTVNIN